MSYDSFAATFSKSRKNLHWEEIDYLVDFMREYFWGAPISLLDIGCGNGRIIKTLEKFETTYLGIDKSGLMIEEAQKLHPQKQFLVLDMEKIDSLHQRFDVILFIASFHHLDTETKQKDVLQKAANLLNPGGIIAMTNWNLLGETLFPKYEKSYKWNGDFSVKIGTHTRYYHGFSVEELQKLFEEIDFPIRENRVFEGEKNILSIIQKSSSL